jgi:hypothetical protein
VKKPKGKPPNEVRNESSDPGWELLEGTTREPWECCIPFPMPARKKCVGRTRKTTSHPRFTLVGGKEKSEPRTGSVGPHPDRSA